MMNILNREEVIWHSNLPNSKMESPGDADAKYPKLKKTVGFFQVLRNCLDIMHWLLVLARTDGTALPFFWGCPAPANQSSNVAVVGSSSWLRSAIRIQKRSATRDAAA